MAKINNKVEALKALGLDSETAIKVLATLKVDMKVGKEGKKENSYLRVKKDGSTKKCKVKNLENQFHNLTKTQVNEVIKALDNNMRYFHSNNSSTYILEKNENKLATLKAFELGGKNNAK